MKKMDCLSFQLYFVLHFFSHKSTVLMRLLMCNQTVFSREYLVDDFYKMKRYRSLLCTPKRKSKKHSNWTRLNPRWTIPIRNFVLQIIISTYLRWRSHLFFFIDWTLELASSICWLLKQRKHDKKMKMTCDQLLSTYCSSGNFFKGREIGGDSRTRIYLPHDILQSKQWIKQRRKR